MAPPIVYVDVSTIREGKHEELELAMNNLAHFVETHMPRVSFYGFFLDDAQATMTVVAVHPDSASLEFHLDEETRSSGRSQSSSTCHGSTSTVT